MVLALPASMQPGQLGEVLHGHENVRVDTVITLVDARLVLSQTNGDDLFADRGRTAAVMDRRSTAELVVGQLEEADVLAVADLHRVGTGQPRIAQALLAHLAPRARQVALGPGGTGCDDAVSIGRHDALTSRSDRERLAGLAV